MHTSVPGAPDSQPRRPVVCVYCGASDGKSPAHLAAARSLAQALHAHSASLVYGGGTVGLMGEVARSLVALSGSSAVHGIIPRALVAHEAPDSVTSKSTNEEVARAIDSKKYGRTTVVDDMHARKALMAKEVSEGGPGSGFVALSGGFGTLEELMEMTTWNQLGIHGLPVVVYNVEGYWDGLLKWVEDAVTAGFIGEANGQIIRSGTKAEDVMMQLLNYTQSEGRFRLTWGQT